MLGSLLEFPVPTSEWMVPAAGIEPAGMVAVGRVSDLPRRSGQLGHGMPTHVGPPADDAVTVVALRTRLDDVAIELAARLAAEHKTAAKIR